MLNVVLVNSLHTLNTDRKQFTKTQYLTFNTHQRHVGQILVSGDDCKQNRSARRTVSHAIGSARRTVLFTAIPII